MIKSKALLCLCYPCILCCCPWVKPKTKKSPSSPRRVIPEMRLKDSGIETTKGWEANENLDIFPEQIKDKDLTKVYIVGDNEGEYDSIDDCLKDQNLEQKEIIGFGGFAKVYKMVDKTNGNVVATKRIQTGEVVRNKKCFDNLKSELYIMIRAQKHPNIVHVFNHFIIKDKKCLKEFCFIVMEFANGGTVLNRMIITDPNQPKIKLAKRLPEKTVKHYFIQIAKGLSFLHSMKVAHKDLKLNNILVFLRDNGQEIIKITDFGLSRIRFDDKKQEIIKEYVGCGTVQFMSPQILRLYIYDRFGTKLDKLHTYDPFRADCWALGVCLYVMICADFPFEFGKQEEEELVNAYHSMKNKDLDFSTNTRSIYSKDCLNLIEELLEPTPDKRLTPEYTLYHKWIKNSLNST